MAKKNIPTIAELREYLEKREAEFRDCIENNKTFVVTGPKFPGESTWIANSTLPLMEAAEAVGTSNEEIWELCSKIASASHAPVTKKEYERMLPFAEKPSTVDAVLKFLETHPPVCDEKTKKSMYDITSFYYCYALISLSDYRKEDCEKQLWDAANYLIENEDNKGKTLLRNMKVLERTRSSLAPMREKLEEAQNS